MTYQKNIAFFFGKDIIKSLFNPSVTRLVVFRKKPPGVSVARAGNSHFGKKFLNHFYIHRFSGTGSPSNFLNSGLKNNFGFEQFRNSYAGLNRPVKG